MPRKSPRIAAEPAPSTPRPEEAALLAEIAEGIRESEEIIREAKAILADQESLRSYFANPWKPTP